ncbi:MAG: hypothetical protein AAGG75_19115 [Bacteroidota bacterium]
MRLIVILFTCFFFTTSLQGQVWPGDINGNGAVDHVDLLYLGYAFGTIGPARDSASIEWTGQSLPLDWAQRFPVSDSTNYAHADCNGDGIIGILDLLALNFNYLDTNGPVSLSTLPQGVAGIDPVMDFDEAGLMGPILQGTTISVPIVLGDVNFPMTQLNGLAFSIRYDPNVINPSNINVFAGTSWFNPSGSELLQLQKNDQNQGKLDIALSRFGVDAIDGSGPIATLFFVIEGDVIDLIPADSMYVEVMIDGVTSINGDFIPSPVVNDTLKMKIVSPEYFIVSNRDIIKDERVRVFPNPAGRARRTSGGSTWGRTASLSCSASPGAVTSRRCGRSGTPRPRRCWRWAWARRAEAPRSWT